MTAKSQVIKRINRPTLKLNFCAANDTIKKVKREPTKWEKISEIYISDKEIISRIYKVFLQLTKTNDPIKNVPKI